MSPLDPDRQSFVSDMTLGELTTRASLLLQKYEKHGSEAKTQKTDGKLTDAFSEECAELEAEIKRLMLIAAEVAHDTSTASVASKNAEIWRVKNILMIDAIRSIQGRITEGKGLNKAIAAARQNQVQVLIEKIYAIPDGMSLAANKRPDRYDKLEKGGKKPMVLLDAEDAVSQHLEDNPLYWKDTEATQQFEKHWDLRRRKQDEILDRLGGHMWHIKSIAENMGDVIEQQNIMIGDIDPRVAKASSNLKNNNVKVRGLARKVT